MQKRWEEQRLRDIALLEELLKNNLSLVGSGHKQAKRVTEELHAAAISEIPTMEMMATVTVQRGRDALITEAEMELERGRKDNEAIYRQEVNRTTGLVNRMNAINSANTASLKHSSGYFPGSRTDTLVELSNRPSIRSFSQDPLSPSTTEPREPRADAFTGNAAYTSTQPLHSHSVLLRTVDEPANPIPKTTLLANAKYTNALQSSYPPPSSTNIPIASTNGTPFQSHPPATSLPDSTSPFFFPKGVTSQASPTLHAAHLPAPILRENTTTSSRNGPSSLFSSPTMEVTSTGAQSPPAASDIPSRPRTRQLPVPGITGVTSPLLSPDDVPPASTLPPTSGTLSTTQMFSIPHASNGGGLCGETKKKKNAFHPQVQNRSIPTLTPGTYALKSTISEDPMTITAQLPSEPTSTHELHERTIRSRIATLLSRDSDATSSITSKAASKTLGRTKSSSDMSRTLSAPNSMIDAVTEENMDEGRRGSSSPCSLPSGTVESHDESLPKSPVPQGDVELDLSSTAYFNSQASESPTAPDFSSSTSALGSGAESGRRTIRIRKRLVPAPAPLASALYYPDNTTGVVPQAQNKQFFNTFQGHLTVHRVTTDVSPTHIPVPATSEMQGGRLQHTTKTLLEVPQNVGVFQYPANQCTQPMPLVIVREGGRLSTMGMGTNLDRPSSASSARKSKSPRRRVKHWSASPKRRATSDAMNAISGVGNADSAKLAESMRYSRRDGLHKVLQSLPGEDEEITEVGVGYVNAVKHAMMLEKEREAAFEALQHQEKARQDRGKDALRKLRATREAENLLQFLADNDADANISPELDGGFFTGTQVPRRPTDESVFEEIKKYTR